jgi:hypothetical protein
MRTVFWMLVGGIVVLFARPAEAQHWLWGQQGAGGMPAVAGGGAGCGCGTACGCGAGCGISLQPGCCENPPRCGDHAWDGYCEEKARWLNWARECDQRFKARFDHPYCKENRAACECGQAGCPGVGEDVYYSQGDSQSASGALPSPPRPAPLTPAMGRRVGYVRPPIRPQH